MSFIVKPSEIEKTSFEIITKELGNRTFPEGQSEVVKRVIHTTADFDYADNLYFSENVIENAKNAILNGATVITDTNMALSGINKKILAQFGGEVHCFMADEQVAREAKERGVTRAIVSMEHAAKLKEPLIFAIGNAPTALIHLYELIKQGDVNPALVVGVPVGFVNVVESKELFISSNIPHIIAKGRKGGSNVAAAIINAILYQLVTREGFEK
ncbi:MAG TPA: precorrin-8X methylmutase [Candidatus Butyricicoccus avistercoris]|uniref:Precorrin-8X methylmutase n=1 Tax=Candidatus Butyricicoccus avistercoris TaxID=2838518 RepID=A0A9D1PIZ1_9FIRM|nr:precorrin-8X methylmutase [Candidatus Butyricicoccus avistercoris]